MKVLHMHAGPGRPRVQLAAVLAAACVLLTAVPAPAAAALVWSPWINVDGPSGSGDYETTRAIRLQGKMPCKEPLAIHCQAAAAGSRPSLVWYSTGQTLTGGCTLAAGIACRNNATQRCMDYQVRFACPTPTKRPTTKSTANTPGVPKCALVTGASVEGMDKLWAAARPKCMPICKLSAERSSENVNTRLAVITYACDPASTRFKLLQSYMGLNIDDATHRIKDISKLCGGLMDNLKHNRSVCGAAFTNEDNTPQLCGSGAQQAGGWKMGKDTTINCAATKPGYANKIGVDGKAFTATDLQAVLDICTTPCMQDTTRTQQCCMVPPPIAHLFQCCRKGGCCADQQRRRAQATPGRREAQVSVSVSVSVTVEKNNAAASPYDALLRCLQNPAKLDAMCLTGSSGH